MDRSDNGISSSSTTPSVPPAAFWKYLQLLANRSESTVASSAVTLAVQAALQFPEEQRLSVALSELERKGVNCDVLMNHAGRLLAMNSNTTPGQTPTSYGIPQPTSTPTAQTPKQSQPARQQNQVAAPLPTNEGSSPFEPQANFQPRMVPHAQQIPPVAQGQAAGGWPRNPQVPPQRPPATPSSQWPTQHPNPQGGPHHWTPVGPNQQHQPPPDRVIRNTAPVPHPLHSWEMEEHYGPVHVPQEAQRPIAATPGAGFMPPVDDGTKFVHEKLQDVMSRRRLSLGASPQERTEIALLIHRTLLRWVIRVWSVLIKFSLLRTDHVRRALDNEVTEDFSAVFCLEGWKSAEEKYKNEVELLSPGKGTDKRKQARKKKGPKSQNNEQESSPHENSQEDNILSSGEAQVAAMMEDENPKEIEESIDALKESGISSYPDFGTSAPDETSTPQAATTAVSTTEDEARNQAVVKRMQGHLTREVSLKDLRQLLGEYSFELPVQLKVRYLRLIEVRHYDSKGAPLMQVLADERSVASRDFQVQQAGTTATTTLSTKFSELLSKSTKPSTGAAPVVEASVQGKRRKKGLHKDHNEEQQRRRV